MRSSRCILAIVAFFPSTVLAQSRLFTEARRMFPADLDDCRALALGDLNADGSLDAIVGSFGSDRLFLNDGTGTFTDATASRLPQRINSTDVIALGDVDGDGDIDAFMGSIQIATLLYLNNGHAAFADATTSNLPQISCLQAIALGDLDQDGDLDAFLGTRWGDGILLNDGHGVFRYAPHTNYPANSLNTQSISLGDVDGDGDLDVLIGKEPPEWNRLFLNDGTGVFVDAPSQIPAGATGVASLGDLNNDNSLDALMGDSVYLNDATGTFSFSSYLPVSTDNTLVLGDVDQDGDLDAFLGNYGRPLHLLQNDGTGLFLDVTPTNLPAITDDYVSALCLGDVDVDGDLDAIVGMVSCRQDRLYLNDSRGVYADVTAAYPDQTMHDTSSIATGDVDNDGDEDILFGNIRSFDGQNRLYLNDGSGALSDVTSSHLPQGPDHTSDVIFGDVDGDGDLDILVANYGEQNRLYLNNGAGVFSEATAVGLPPDTDSTWSLDLGDVDRDGDLDAIIGNGARDRNRLFLNTGAGVFADMSASNLPAIGYITFDLAFVDMDGDDDLDLFFGTCQQDRLFLNDGTGVFVDVSPGFLPQILDYTVDIDVGDVDGDGDVDLLTGSFTSIRLYLNDGSGRCSEVSQTHLPPAISGTRSLAFGDVDCDGDLDFMIGRYSDSLLFLNDGLGFFSDGTSLLAGDDCGITEAVAFADLDLDGDFEAVLGTAGQNRIYSNLTWQVTWRAIARIGKPLAFDLWGPRNGAWQFAMSFGQASIPVPPMGVLLLEPIYMSPLQTGSLDSERHAALTLDVPRAPSLVGSSLYWQALFAFPLRLSNLEITTFSDL